MSARVSGRVVLALVGVLVVVLLSACGSSSSSSSSSVASSGASQGSASSSSGGSGTSGSSCATTAHAATLKAEAPVPVSLPTSSLDMKKNAGKSVWMVEEVQNPLGQSIGNAFISAANAAGMKPKVLYGTGTSASWNTDVQEAVAQGANAIVLYGIAPGQVPTPMAQAAAKKITVVDIFNGSPSDPLPKGVFAHVTPDFKQAGINAANWELAASHCNVKTAIFGAQVLNLHQEFMSAMKSTITSACPTCQAKVENVDLGTLATSFGPQVNTVLTGNTGLNYLTIVFDAGVQLVEPAIRQSFSKIPIVSHDGVDANLNAIRGGGQQVYDGAFAPPAWVGYALVDEVGRGLAGAPAEHWVIPERVIDKTNIGSSNASIWANWSSFRTGFTKAWGLA